MSKVNAEHQDAPPPKKEKKKPYLNATHHHGSNVTQANGVNDEISHFLKQPC